LDSVQEEVQCFTKDSEVTDVVPRYPNEIGRIRIADYGNVPLLAIDPDDWTGAEGFFMSEGEGAEVAWRFQETPEGRSALLTISEAGTDVDIRLVFEGWDRDDKGVLFDAARTGWLAITSVERFSQLMGENEVRGVAVVPVRRDDLHEFLTA
jgi:hypothetical protein